MELGYACNRRIEFDQTNDGVPTEIDVDDAPYIMFGLRGPF